MHAAHIMQLTRTRVYNLPFKRNRMQPILLSYQVRCMQRTRTRALRKLLLNGAILLYGAMTIRLTSFNFFDRGVKNINFIFAMLSVIKIPNYFYFFDNL